MGAILTMGLHAIIVDDERLALKKMEKLLTEQTGRNKIERLMACYNPYDAIEIAQREQLHVAFLDIEMPEINGFELAERLLQIHPKLHIIFVTAYQEYAVKAFELNALDYLLKPVHHNRLALTLQRLTSTNPHNGAAPAISHERTPQLTLCCLQSLHYIDANGAAQRFPWKTLKAQELFAYLLYYREKTVNKQVLMDLLWPNYDTERATTQLHTAIYQIRKMIKTAELDIEVKYKDEGYRLAWGALSLDVEEWENSVRLAPLLQTDTLAQHLAILNAYTGDFLEEHRYGWAEYEWERIRTIWLNHAKAIAQFYLSDEMHSEATLIYRQIIDKFPHMEHGYFALMNIYASLNHSAEVRKLYNLLTSRLEEEYDTAPSKEIIDWYHQWMMESAQANGSVI
ncbi:response regulator [Paenibacillus alvei]|uniref:response regulator n=1 Tax=Paenibacillus alvei TaxID=44250 RepID=UPI0022812B15|nr:response regulator [Paenibacillus alvei]